MRLYSYVVALDFGFAPNPFHGWCTLATCKPEIRGSAAVGDWVLGTGSKPAGLEGHVVYVMQVEEILTFEAYSADTRFACKKPNLRGSTKMAHGDNIYSRSPSGAWVQADSRHSFTGGALNEKNLDRDTKANAVLISANFSYLGGAGPPIPSRFRNWKDTGIDVCAGRGHKCIFPDDLVDAFVKWVIAACPPGVLARPRGWPNPH